MYRFFCFLVLLLPIPAIAEVADFSLPDLDGKMHSLSDYRGKWVVVNYWATWCPPCLEEIPGLVEFHDSRKDRDAVVLGVNHEEADPEWLEEFVESHFITYPILRAEPEPETPLGPVMGLPTTFIVSPQGKLIARQEGAITREALEAYIDRKNKEMNIGPSAFLQVDQ